MPTRSTGSASTDLWTQSIARKVPTQGAAKSWVTKPWRATQKSILKSLHTDPLPVRGKFVERELDITRKLHHGDLLQQACQLRAGAQKGRIADLVLLRANPLVDIRNTREISAVIADGRYISQAEIDLLRQRLKQLAAAR